MSRLECISNLREIVQPSNISVDAIVNTETNIVRVNTRHEYDYSDCYDNDIIGTSNNTFNDNEDLKSEDNIQAQSIPRFIALYIPLHVIDLHTFDEVWISEAKMSIIEDDVNVLGRKSFKFLFEDGNFGNTTVQRKRKKLQKCFSVMDDTTHQECSKQFMVRNGSPDSEVGEGAKLICISNLTENEASISFFSSFILHYRCLEEKEEENVLKNKR
eukprot:g4152.t1